MSVADSIVSIKENGREANMKLWLDDIRRLPRLKPGIESDWVLAHSVNEAIKIMNTGKVTFASLDHDLGIWTSEGGNGIKLLDWMAENNIWPTDGISIHSSNPVGVQQMLALIERYAPYYGEYHHSDYFDYVDYIISEPVYVSRPKKN